MKAFTHIAAGLAATLIVIDVTHATASHAVFLVAGGIIGSMLPDIDYPKSAFGARIIPISTIISGIFGHRGITHSLIALVGVALGGWYYMRDANLGNVEWQSFLAGLLLGYLSHLAGDYFSNSGIPLLWPSKRRFVSPLRVFTGDKKEFLLALVLYAWDALEMLKIGELYR